jgi:hypothetical protein
MYVKNSAVLMGEGFSYNLPGRKRALLVRVIAVFFLLYTGADITFPQMCKGGELINLSDSVRVPTSTLGAAESTIRAVSNVTSSEPSRSPQHSDQVPDDEDCFCCCAHVLPGMNFYIAIRPTPVTLTFNAKKDRLPSPPLRSTFRPPRFA